MELNEKNGLVKRFRSATRILFFWLQAEEQIEDEATASDQYLLNYIYKFEKSKSKSALVPRCTTLLTLNA
jgi:hypothetical protein